MAWSRPRVGLLRLPGLLAVTCTSALSRPTDGDVVDEDSLLLESGVPLNALPLAQTLQQKVIKQDFDIEDGEEESRSHGITEGSGTYRGEMLMDAPVVTFVPSLAPHSAYSRHGQSSKSGQGSEVNSSPSSSPPSPGGSLHLRGRHRLVYSQSNSVPESALELRLAHAPWVKHYRQDRDWGSLTARLDAYLLHLGLYDVQYRRKSLCQMYDDPKSLASLSQLPVSESRKRSKLKRPLSSSSAIVRILPCQKSEHFSSSTTSSFSCAQQYSARPVSASDAINPQVFLFLKNLANSELRLSDE